MIHSSRRKCGKENAVVYGVATDGFEYRFWRIDNQSVVSVSDITSKIVKTLKSFSDHQKQSSGLELL